MAANHTSDDDASSYAGDDYYDEASPYNSPHYEGYSPRSPEYVPGSPRYYPGSPDYRSSRYSPPNLRYGQRQNSRSRSRSPSIERSSTAFSAHQRNQFDTMRKDGVLTDVIVKCEDVTFPCHKLILASASTFFERMFQIGMKEAKENEVRLNGFEESTLKLILDYMYTSKMHITWDNIDEILWGADYLQMEVLKRDCENFLAEYLNADYALRIYKLARACNLLGTEKDAWDIIKLEFRDVMRSREFRELALDDLIDIVRCDRLALDTEDAVFQAVLMWVKFNPKERRMHFMERLLPLIRLPYCSKSFLCHIINHEEMMSSEPCQAALAKALASSIRPMHTPETLPKVKPRLDYYANRTRIVLYGGIGISDAINNKMWYLDGDPYTKSKKKADWVEIQHQPLPDFDPIVRYSLCQVPNGMFITGGSHSTTSMAPSSHSYYYDGRESLWHHNPDMHYPREAHVSIFVGRFVYVIGGKNDTGNLEVVCRFDLGAQRWVSLEDDILHAVCHPAVASFGLSIYLFGGGKDDTDDSTYTHHTQVYDTIIERWTPAAPMPVRPEHASAVTYKDGIFVVGGFKSPVCMNYSPSLDTWALLSTPLYDHSDAASIVYKDCIMLCGGGYLQDDTLHTQDTVECYNIAENRWDEVDVHMKDLPKKLRFISFAHLTLLHH